ncbi:hypothetical protein F2Q68_00010250 [Brassica cretica]|uniref:Uncharacterized protein n=1 Tax=Brassica cretica TaxID=69181 RepID=A0A8S9KRZ7_BRACR|nr:hypothetical protein F2Q68_00010250 [Brassica cretica]
MNSDLPTSLVGGRVRPCRLFTDPFSSPVASFGEVSETDSEFHHFPDVMKHFPNVLLSLLSHSEDNPQPVCVINFIKRFLHWDSEDSLMKPFISFSLASLLRFLGIFSFLFLNLLPSVSSSTRIGSAVVCEGLVVGSGGFAKGLGGGLSALIRLLSIEDQRSTSLDAAAFTSTDSRTQPSTDIQPSSPTDLHRSTLIDTTPRTSIDHQSRNMVAIVILRQDENGNLYDQVGHLRNATGQKLDAQGNVHAQQYQKQQGQTPAILRRSCSLRTHDLQRPTFHIARLSSFHVD